MDIQLFYAATLWNELTYIGIGVNIKFLVMVYEHFWNLEVILTS